MPADPRPAPAAERIALLLWGDVIEDYLDPIGLTVDAFLDEVSSGWMFGYIAGLRSRGVETILVLVSRGVGRPRRAMHTPSGTTAWLLPPSPGFRAAGRVMSRLGDGGFQRRLLRALVREARAYSTTPVVRLARTARRERVRAIVCQEYETPRFDVCVALGAALRIPVFGTFQGGSRQHHRLERPVRPISIRRAAGVVIGASSEIDRVTARYGIDPRAVAHIGNPVLSQRGLDWRGLRRRGREELGAGADTVVVAWHGRVEIQRKGLDVLLAAWRRVLERTVTRDVRLALMGTGGDADRLRDLLEPFTDTVSWVDEYVTDRERIDRFLAAADIYAFPSPHEGFPVAPVEAMLAGSPVVATAAPGIDDIFEGGEAAGGIVVPVGDVDAFGRSLVDLVGDAAKRARLGEAARRRAEERYSVEAVGRQLHDFLHRRGTRLHGVAAAGAAP